MKLKAYVYISLKHPKKDDEEDTTLLDEGIVLAETEEKAKMKVCYALRSVTTESNLDCVEVLVRPF